MYSFGKPTPLTFLFEFFLLILSEELRSEITQDACMCEAQILFQKKVQSTIQALITKHILLYLEHSEVSQCTRNITHLYFVPLERRLYFVFNVLFDVLYLIFRGYFL